MEHHLPYGIMQCYLPLDMGEHVLPQSKHYRIPIIDCKLKTAITFTEENGNLFQRFES